MKTSGPGEGRGELGRDGVGCRQAVEREFWGPGGGCWLMTEGVASRGQVPSGCGQGGCLSTMTLETAGFPPKEDQLHQGEAQALRGATGQEDAVPRKDLPQELSGCWQPLKVTCPGR